MANQTKGPEIILLAIHPSDEGIETPREGANFVDVVDLDGLHISKPAPATDAGPFVFENFLALFAKPDEDTPSVTP